MSHQHWQVYQKKNDVPIGNVESFNPVLVLEPITTMDIRQHPPISSNNSNGKMMEGRKEQVVVGGGLTDWTDLGCSKKRKTDNHQI
eukprot:CAMPEP_0195302950 /NCGR_PEP_ID=MMETSP0707-20130614/31970_1 /TAXON_ID=33640 /ORGANISM="Asterionellopsis glacialis, Strain CCMP134" /LENGTH=85 /DNA_ID=CAMNT_0040366339 /DNA_START=169 /DNA_END=426 /DNA_ORIENTATION=+